jgi:hypothetical protein
MQLVMSRFFVVASRTKEDVVLFICGTSHVIAWFTAPFVW